MRRIILILLTFIVASFSEENNLNLFIYGDVRSEYLNLEDKANFKIGDTDILGIFTRGNFEVLMEVFIEQPDNFVDFERLYVKWEKFDIFRITLGKFHPSLGYASMKWHHGLHLMTIPDRPQIINFEDEGGPLLAHGLGIRADGLRKLKGIFVGYSIDIINGNQQFGADNSSDFDKYKSVVAKLYIKPTHFSEIGISGAYDPTDVNSELLNKRVKTTNRILGLNLVYDKPGGTEFIAEYYKIDELISDKSAWGGFILISYPLIKGGNIYEFRPFLLLEKIDWEYGNEWFINVLERLRLEEEQDEYIALTKKTGYTLGFKLSFSPYTALKISYTYSDNKDIKDTWNAKAVLSFMIPAYGG